MCFNYIRSHFVLFLSFLQVWSIRDKKNAEHWEVMFNALSEYKTAHGNCLVPSRYSNTKLAKWVENVRSEYAKLQTVTDASGLRKIVPSSKLTADRIQRLEWVGFEWRVKAKPKAESEQVTTPSDTKPKSQAKKLNHDKQWDLMLSHLQKYKDTYGHTRVPKRYKENPSLGVWCDTQVSKEIHYISS